MAAALKQHDCIGQHDAYSGPGFDSPQLHMKNTKRKTRKEEVLAELKTRRGGWVPGYDLANQYVGGSEGIRRLRELRAEGRTIEKRTRKGITEYRLIS